MQRSYRLCGKDDKYHSRTCKAVKQKAAASTWTTRECERCSGQRPDHCSLLGEDVPALRGGESPSLDGSRLQTNLGPAQRSFRGNGLEGLQDAHGESVYYTSLAKKLGRATIQHIRVLCVRHLRPCGQRP